MLKITMRVRFKWLTCDSLGWAVHATKPRWRKSNYTWISTDWEPIPRNGFYTVTGLPTKHRDNSRNIWKLPTLTEIAR